MSGAVQNRAAVFTSQPQDVEVWSSGEWLPGSLLGWRHDDTGSCQVWVRLTVGGTEESRWTDLECLRLPEPAVAAPAPAASAVAARAEDLGATRSLRLVDAGATGPARRGRPVIAAVPRPRSGERAGTGALPALRDESASRASHPAGRRRADTRVPGETAEFPAVPAPGRHRAPGASGLPGVPAVPGRHRADTGAWPGGVDRGAPALADDLAATAAWTRVEDTWPGRAPGPDLLTRPMRLGSVAGGVASPSRTTS